MSNYHEELNELFAQDPAGATAFIAQQAAQVAAQQVAAEALQQGYAIGSAQNDAVMQGQANTAYMEADRGLSRKYGEDWVESRDAVIQTINDHPELLPNEQRFDPQTVADRLELIYKATRQDRAIEEDRNAWDRIHNSGFREYADLHKPPTPTSE